MAGNVAGAARPVMLDLQGYGNQEEGFIEEGKAPAVAYKIPPVVWMIVFLIAGYLGMRFVMED